MDEKSTLKPGKAFIVTSWAKWIRYDFIMTILRTKKREKTVNVFVIILHGDERKACLFYNSTRVCSETASKKMWNEQIMQQQTRSKIISSVTLQIICLLTILQLPNGVLKSVLLKSSKLLDVFSFTKWQ